MAFGWITCVEQYSMVLSHLENFKIISGYTVASLTMGKT